METVWLWNVKTRQWDEIPMSVWEMFFQSHYALEDISTVEQRYRENYMGSGFKTDPTLEEFSASRI